MSGFPHFDLRPYLADEDKDERPRVVGYAVLLALGIVALVVTGYKGFILGEWTLIGVILFGGGFFLIAAGLFVIIFLRSLRINSVTVDTDGFTVGRPGPRKTVIRWMDPAIDFYLNDASAYRGTLPSHAVPSKYTIFSARSKIGKIGIPPECFVTLLSAAKTHGAKVDADTNPPTSKFAGIVHHHITCAAPHS